jgi:hypothetical protein
MLPNSSPGSTSVATHRELTGRRPALPPLAYASAFREEAGGIIETQKRLTHASYASSS